MNFIIFIIIPAAMLIIIEIFQRKFSISPIVTRKMSHISAALIAAISPLFLNKDLIILICLGFAGLMFWSRRNNFLSSIHTRIRNTFGEVFLPLGEAFSAAIFLPQATPAFQYGVLVMGISDASAGLVGEKFGRHQINIFCSKKSLEGSIAFLLSCLFLTFLFFPEIGFHLIWIPLLLTLIELLLGYGLDNIAIPVIAAFLFQYLTSSA